MIIIYPALSRFVCLKGHELLEATRDIHRGEVISKDCIRSLTPTIDIFDSAIMCPYCPFCGSPYIFASADSRPRLEEGVDEFVYFLTGADLASRPICVKAG